MVFDSNDEQDRVDLKIVNMAQDMHNMLWNFDQHMRNAIKYQGKDNWQEVRDSFYDFINEYNIELDV